METNRMINETPIYVATERDRIREICRVAAREYGLDEKLFLRQMKQESGFDPDANKDKPENPCKGLAQINLDFYQMENPYDPQESAELAANIMRQYLDAYQGNILKALAAYNWGPGNLGKAMADAAARYGSKGYWIWFAPPETCLYWNQVIGGDVGDD